MPDEFEKQADAITSAWWDHMKNIGQLDTPLGDLDQIYWAELDASIAAALRERAKAKTE